MSKPDNFKAIKDSFETSFENVSSKEMIHRLNTHSGSTPQDVIKTEMTRRLIDEIEAFNKSSSKQSEVMIKLTRWIAVLTIAMLIIGIIQIILFFIK